MKKTLLATLSITALLAVAAALPANDPVESLQTKVASLRAKVEVAEAKSLEIQALTCQLVAQQKQPEPPPPPATKRKGPPINAKTGKPHKTGAKKTPLPKILQAINSGCLTVHRVLRTTPAQVAMVPGRLSFWGNDVDGDCVSAESAFAIAGYSVYVGLPEIFIPEKTLVSWAQSHNFLNGADLLEVIQAMQTDGIADENGVLRKEGIPSVVDYTDEAAFKNAISVGPLSIAIDSSALPNTAGNQNGWCAFGGTAGDFTSTDHCVSVAGYGPTQFLATALGLGTVRPDAPANAYLIFTWDTIGLVDFPWIQSTCVQSFLRTPTVVGLTPTPPPPPPPPPSGVVTIALTADQVQSVVQQAGAATNPPGSVVLSPATVQALLADLQTAAGKAKQPR